MRTRLLAIAVCLPLLWAGDKKVEPGAASNDAVEITASVITDKAELQQALGAELPPGVVAVKLRLRPKGEQPLKLHRDDFVLLKSDDGQRSTPFAPSQLAGNGGLMLQSKRLGGWAAQGNGPVWGGVSGVPRQGPLSGGGIGSQTAQVEGVEAKAAGDKPSGDKPAGDKANGKPQQDPYLTLLKSKELPEKSTTEPVEGLLFFPLDGKIKLKNLSLFYKAPGDRLEVRFQR